MSAQLTPVFPSDLITPGVIYFARLDAQRSSDINSWWLVLRCAEDLLPQPFLDSKNLQARTFPFWVIGRRQFVWLDRGSLFILHPSQKSAFQQTDLRNSFDTLYELATGAAKTDPFAVFREQILDTRTQYLSQVDSGITERASQPREPSSTPQSAATDTLFIAEDEGDNDNASSNNAVRPSSTPKRRPRRRVSLRQEKPQNNRERPSVEIQERPTLLGLQSPKQPRARIKTEDEEYQVQYASAVNAAERVRIFVGTKEFTTSRQVLEKSPVLSSYIQRDDVGLFIMHPKLNETKEEDLLTVLDFMQRGDFRPRMINLPVGQRRTGPLPLEGLIGSEDYSKELIRCGRLYLLAKVFQIYNLKQYIVHRIITAQYRPYTIASIITLARIIFRYSGNHQAGIQWGSTTSPEAMEQWIIGSLAENFREIMQVVADRDLFWIMEKETASRRLVAEVFIRCADNYSKIGGMPVKID